MIRKKPLILIVDDTEATRYSVARYLSREGFEVSEAGTGQTGLDLVDSLRPDLVILNIHLPDMLGFEVCKRIKADPDFARIPVLQISASYVNSNDKITGLEGGADSYLTHPVEPPVLVATVKALLRFRDVYRDLENTNVRLRAALEVAPVALCEFDREGRIVWFHSSNSPLGPEDYIGKTPFDLFGKDEGEPLAKMLESVRETQKPSKQKIKSPARNAVYELTVEPKFEGSRVVGFFGAALDITASENARETVEQAREAAEKANRSKSQFIANVSHEIRTPLGVILGFSDLILGRQQSEVEDENALLAIKRNAIQLSKLVDEILDLSKLEADRMEIEKIEVDFPELLSEIIALLERQARAKKLSLRVELKTPIPKMICTDPTRLRQILINLVSNGIKFTDAGEVVIEVSSERTYGPTPNGSSKPIAGDRDNLVIRVRDTGIGITPDQEEKLFAPFSQADQSTTRRFGGTGLGLMLSRRLSHALGGGLVLSKSEFGVGSTFELTVSCNAISNTFVNSLTAYTESGGVSTIPKILHHVRVLLVEDSPDNQALIGRLLTFAGAEVDMASNGRLGVDKAKQNDYDVVLMDIQMPEMDGYDAARELKEAQYPKPVIALTAHALKGERERCLAAGFSDYLTKPIDRHKLFSAIQLHARTDSSPKFV